MKLLKEYYLEILFVADILIMALIAYIFYSAYKAWEYSQLAHVCFFV